MARKKSNEVLVGLFVLAGIVLFLVLIFAMGSFGGFLSPSARIAALFTDVQGLQPGDPVYLFGMRVGQVDSITVTRESESEPAKIRVAMSVPESYREFLRVNTKVHISKSLTGSLSVLFEEAREDEIRAGKGLPLPPGQALEGVHVRDLAEMQADLDALLVDAKEAVASISRVVKDVEAKGDLPAALTDFAELAKETRAKIDALSTGMKETLESVDQLLQENREGIRETVANLKDATGTARSFLDKLGSTPEKLEESLVALKEAGRAVEGAVTENRTNIDVILEDLRTTMTNSANLTAEVKRRPWRLLYRPSESEKKALELYDAAWAYNLGATELNRSVRVLADRLNRTPPEGSGQTQLLERAIQQVRASLEKQRQAEERFWSRLLDGE